MFVQSEQTPNPNTLKFMPDRSVSEVGSQEFIDVKQTNNQLVKDLLSIKEVVMIFLGTDFKILCETGNNKIIYSVIRDTQKNNIEKCKIAGGDQSLIQPVQEGFILTFSDFVK